VFKRITYEYQVYKVMSRGRSRALTRNPSVVIFELPDIGNPGILYESMKEDMKNDFIFRFQSLHLNIPVDDFICEIIKTHDKRLKELKELGLN
jgi:hypothetical protein